MRTIRLEANGLGWLQFASLASRPELVHFASTLQEAPVLQAALSVGRVHLSRQIHSNRIAIVSGQTEELHGFDALVAAERGVCVGVSTADCVPVLLYATDRRVVAAVHAGWRGTVGGITMATVALMADVFGCEPRFMLAGIAPAIGGDAFEVGGEVREAFLGAGFDISPFHRINPASGKSHIDLKIANYVQLLSAGLVADNIEVADACTFSEAGAFTSARRQGADCRRMISGIMLRAEG